MRTCFLRGQSYQEFSPDHKWTFFFDRVFSQKTMHKSRSVEGGRP